jgi:hypothetical protein
MNRKVQPAQSRRERSAMPRRRGRRQAREQSVRRKAGRRGARPATSAARPRALEEGVRGRQPVGRTGGKGDGERQPVPGEREEEQEDAGERPRRPAAGGSPPLAHPLSDSFGAAIDPSPHPRWYS